MTARVGRSSDARSSEKSSLVFSETSADGQADGSIGRPEGLVMRRFAVACTCVFAIFVSGCNGEAPQDDTSVEAAGVVARY
jgi:hypothetical protein